MKSKDNTASFMIRFTQNIYADDEGKDQIQWRGKISHVQSGKDKGFVEFDKAVDFMQDHLEQVTSESVEDKSSEERDTLLEKSFSMFNKFRKSAPKIVMETIKDPLGQVENIQGQIKEQLRDVSGELSQKLDMDKILAASKNDYKDMMSMMKKMSKQIDKLNKKVDQLESKK